MMLGSGACMLPHADALFGCTTHVALQALPAPIRIAND